MIPELTWTLENIWTARLIYHLGQFTISDQNFTFDQSIFDGRLLSTSSTKSKVTDTYLLTYLLILPSCYCNATFTEHFGSRILYVLIENSSPRITNRNEDYESLWSDWNLGHVHTHESRHFWNGVFLIRIKRCLLRTLWRAVSKQCSSMWPDSLVSCRRIECWFV